MMSKAFLSTQTPAAFSFGVLFALIAILVASGGVFYVLNLQWTTHRPIEALREWARDREFYLLLGQDAALPLALRGLESLYPQVEVKLTCGELVLIRLSTAVNPGLSRQTWHLLVRESSSPQNPMGLRPAGATVSFLDLFALNSYPSLLPPERFVIHATDSKDARKMAASPVRGLLPADIGLLVHGQYLTLDFSTRPFDAIEFDRMLAVMAQVAGKA